MRYALIGGLAATLHGSPYPTVDVDITPAADRANLGRLASALRLVHERSEPRSYPIDERSLVR